MHLAQSNNIIQNRPYSPALVPGATKSLTTTKTLATGNSELAAWYEDAIAFYNAVLSGTEQQPDPARWAELMEQMQWASQQLGLGQDWDPTADSAAPAAGLEPDAFGGVPGTMNNYAYNEETARLGFSADGVVRDIWSNDFTLDVAPLSAKVTAEKTQDTRHNPPEDVIKIVVKDPATGKENVYFVHDYQDAKIKINVPQASQVTNQVGDPVTVGKFTKGGSGSESKVAGEAFKDGTLYEAPTAADTIEFTPQAGENAIHYVIGNSDISLPVSSKAAVSASDKPEYDHKIVVTHKDGSTDTYYVRKEFKTNINAVKDYVQFGQNEAGKVPSELKEIFSINGDSAGSEGDLVNPEPSSVSSDGHTATYESEEDPTFKNNFDGEIEDYVVVANGTLTLEPANQSDRFTVTLEERDGQLYYYILVNGKNSEGNPRVLEYHVKADQIQNIDIKASEAQVNVLIGTVSELEGLDKAEQQAYKDKIKIGGQAIVDEAEQNSLEAASRLLGQLGFATGKSESEILSKIKEIYPEFISYDADHDGALSKEELAKGIQEGKFPPRTPDEKFFRLLGQLDATLGAAAPVLGAAASMANLQNVPGIPAAADGIFHSFRDRLISLLNAVYPGQATSIEGDSRKVRFTDASGSVREFDVSQLFG